MKGKRRAKKGRKTGGKYVNLMLVYIIGEVHPVMAKLMYENRFLLGRKLHKEYFRFFYRKTQKKTQLIAGILAALSLGLSGFLFFGLHSRIGAGIGVILALYFVFVIFFGYAFREWLQYRELEDLHGKGIFQMVRFYSDQVQVTVNKTKFSFKYSTIAEAYESDELLTLILKTKGMPAQGQPLYKNGFTGNIPLDEFKSFINQKTGKKIFEQKA